MKRQEIITLIERLEKLVRKTNYEGYDPYDALSSSLLYRLSQKNQQIARVFIQGFRFFPFNFRTFLGIHPQIDSKAIALIGRFYFLFTDYAKKEEYQALATYCLELLQKISIKGFSGMGWGHPFPFFSRRGFLPANFPNAVCTVYAAHAFLDGYERVERTQWLEFARSACNFILNDLPRIKRDDAFCFSYYPGVSLPIHNANLLVAWLLGRVAHLSGEKDLLKPGLKALNYTLMDQQPDGSWFYDGPDSPFRDNTFVDGFHTGFVLESLLNISQNCEVDLQHPIQKAFKFYLNYLFNSMGQPYRFVNKPWPLDLRDCAQAIIVLSMFSNKIPNGKQMLHQILKWTLNHMQSPNGHFYSFRWGKFFSPIFYIRFQAWMLFALTTYLLYSDANID